MTWTINGNQMGTERKVTRGRMKLRLAAVMVLLISTVVVVSACGSSSSSSTTSNSSGNGESTTASEGSSSKPIVTPPPTSPPTELPISKPLNGPPPQQTVAWAACELPICQEGLSAGWHEAGKALGWNVNQINYKSLEPDKAVQQALDEKVDGIGITGVAPALFETQAKQAIKEEVPIVSASEITEPEPTVNGLYWQGQNTASVEESATMSADWAINDSGGKANVVAVTIESFPILSAEVVGLEKAYKQCSECSLGVLPVTIENLGEGSVPSKIAAYLQSHPEVNYVQFTFSDLATGVYEALKPLGLTGKVQLIGGAGNPTNMQEIVEGKASMWMAQPQQYVGWLGMDVLARLATNTPLEPYEKEGKIPYWVVEKAGAEELLEKSEGAWPGPEGFQQKFEELWSGS